MDEAFMSLSETLEKLLSIDGEIANDGIRSYIYAFDVGTPVELDVVRDENGQLNLGSVPPLFRVETTFRPSYHNISFTAERINHTEEINPIEEDGN